MPELAATTAAVYLLLVMIFGAPKTFQKVYNVV